MSCEVKALGTQVAPIGNISVSLATPVTNKTAAGVAQDRARMLGLAAGAWEEAERRDPESWPIVYESALALLRYRDAVQKYSLALPIAWLGPDNRLAGLSVDQMTVLAGGYVDKLKILDPLGKEAAKIEAALPLQPAGH